MQYLSLSFSTHIVSSLLRKFFLYLISGIELGGLNRALAEVVGSPSSECPLDYTNKLFVSRAEIDCRSFIALYRT